jgi:two-component system chemotaxis sensor kinase CheA
MTTDFDMSQYLGVFLEEAEEQLQILSEGILLLEKEKDNQELLNKIFRAAHTLKGSSASMGYNRMAILTHEMENLLERFRHGQLAVSKEIIDVLLACVDSLQLLKEEITGNKENEIDIDSLTEKLKNVIGSPPPIPVPSQDLLDFNETEQYLMVTAQKQGYQIFEIYVVLMPQCLMKSARVYIIFKNIEELGEIVKTVPATEDLEAENFDNSFRIILVTKEEIDTVRQSMQKISEIEQVTITLVKPEEKFDKENATGDITSQENQSNSGRKSLEYKIGQTVRVDVQRLDNLLNLVGELVIDRTRLAEVGNNLRTKLAAEELVETLEEVSIHIGRITGELQEEIMKARMFPIEQVFKRFPRMVRDLAQKAGKEINFSVEGQETELDRTVIEEITDPLIHLLRNSIDHGIEKPELRQKIGKAPQGTIKLRAYNQENQIIISVEDDGKGIDLEKVREKAVANGILSSENISRLTNRELINLIFAPGFSTADKISDVSGRGVGMDIVRNHLEKINGIIEVDTQSGIGTRFIIKLPLTLAINRSLLVYVGKQVLAFPLANVVEVISITPEKIQFMQQQKVILVRGEVLPLFSLAELLNTHLPRLVTSQLPVVIVGYGEKRFGFIVDALIGEQEIVIKSLGEFIGQIPGLAGATILGDGRVALILDIRGLIDQTRVNASCELVG